MNNECLNILISIGPGRKNSTSLSGAVSTSSPEREGEPTGCDPHKPPKIRVSALAAQKSRRGGFLSVPMVPMALTFVPVLHRDEDMLPRPK